MQGGYEVTLAVCRRVNHDGSRRAARTRRLNVSFFTMLSASHSVRSRLRLLVGRCIWLLIALMVTRTWYLEGLIVPCRVQGGSMAETLLGLCREVVCADCGRRFVCGTDVRPVSPRAVCPNCGCADNDLQVQPDLAGDRVLVDKSIFHFRPPRRWEIVALRRPRQAGTILIKRVVGLPGEVIQIKDGNVYVDGHIKRKTLAQQWALAVLVHDANCRPTINPVPPPRWQGTGQQSRWGSAGGRFAHPATSNKQFDWLEYRHWRRKPGKEGGILESPISDGCGYNQTRPRRVEDTHPVTELLLSLRLIETWGQGCLSIKISDGREQFEARIFAGRNSYQTFRSGRPIPAGAGKLPPCTGDLMVEVSIFDCQFLLAFDGSVAVAWPYDPSPEGPRPTARPLAIGSQGLGVVIDKVRVYRDVYYTHPIGLQGRWGLDEPVRLAADEYFVLGDNSPISEDSRTWPVGPAVAAKLLTGKPLVVHFPAREVELGGWIFQVPDPAKIRYIR